VDDVSPDVDRSDVLETLYRTASAAPELELLLNSVPDVDGDQATVSSISVVLGGDRRDPHIVRCEHVIHSLHRDVAGQWHVDARRPHGHAQVVPPGAEPA
jgi:hypothetical protein